MTNLCIEGLENTPRWADFPGLFRLNTLKGTAKAPAVNVLTLTTLRDTKTAFITLKRYDKYPRVFYMGGPPDEEW